MSAFDTGHTHNLLVYEDDMTLHRRKKQDGEQCRPTHESAYDGKLYVISDLVEEGFDICPECLPDQHERYGDD